MTQRYDRTTLKHEVEFTAQRQEASRSYSRQYGTTKPGTSLAERQGVRTAPPTSPRLSAHPKGGASPSPAGDALEYAAACLEFQALIEDGPTELAVINRRLLKLGREVKAAFKAGNDALGRMLQHQRASLQAQRQDLSRRLKGVEREAERLEEWRIERTNKGFSPQRGYLAGKDISAEQVREGRTTRGRADAERIKQNA